MTVIEAGRGNSMTKVVGVDVGGTFTDLVLVDEMTGEVRLAKVPTTPRNQAAGVLAALTATAEVRRRR